MRFDLDAEKLQTARATALEQELGRDPALRLVLGPLAILISAAVTFALWLAVHASLWVISPALAIGLGLFLTPLFILAGIAIPASQQSR